MPSGLAKIGLLRPFPLKLTQPSSMKSKKKRRKENFDHRRQLEGLRNRKTLSEISFSEKIVDYRFGGDKTESD